MWEKDGARGGEREGIREIVRKGETERGRGRGRESFEHVLLGTYISMYLRMLHVLYLFTLDADIDGLIDEDCTDLPRKY